MYFAQNLAVRRLAEKPPYRGMDAWYGRGAIPISATCMSALTPRPYRT